jgi:hypothetical protein
VIPKEHPNGEFAGIAFRRFIQEKRIAENFYRDWGVRRVSRFPPGLNVVTLIGILSQRCVWIGPGTEVVEFPANFLGPPLGSMGK